MKRILGIAASAAALLIAGAGSAATVVNVVVDLNTMGSLTPDGTLLTVIGAKLATPVSIPSGDVVYNITFAGNETLTLSNPDSITVSLTAAAHQPLISGSGSGQLTLLSSPSNYVSSSSNYTFSTSDTIGQTDDTDSLDATSVFKGSNALPDPLTITGLTWSGTINYTNGTGVPDTYDLPSFQISADDITVAGGVPEPATWAMMLVGFGGIGAAMRSRRNSSVKFA